MSDILVDVAYGQPHAPAGIPIYRPHNHIFTAEEAERVQSARIEAAKNRLVAEEAARAEWAAKKAAEAEREAREAPIRRAEAARRGAEEAAELAVEEAARRRTNRRRCIGQLVAIWLAAAALLLVGLPSIVGDLVEERNTQEGICVGIGKAESEILSMLVTRNLGDCEIGDKANTIRGLAWIFIIAVLISLIVLTVASIRRAQD